MKKSIYNIIVNYKEHYLIYNALKASCVILKKDEYEAFDSFTCLGEEEKEYIRLGLYVEDDDNEVDMVLYSSRVLTDKDKRQYYRIYTTLGCNAKCPYCYQQGNAPISMSKKTADSICEFIVERMINGASLTIEWFGGEPLLNKEIIDYICNQLTPICERNKIKFSSRMVSNGFLIDAEVVKKAINVWKLSQIQITLDGLKETYEIVKGFDESDSFEHVINNIG